MRIETPRWALPLLQPARYKGAHGGRAGGKSHVFAEMVIEYCLMHPGARVVCVREFQASLRESVKYLLEAKIKQYNLERYFIVQDFRIKAPGGGLIIFHGLQSNNAEAFKSLEGADIVWVEEAQTLSKRSLDILRPTVRKPGSEIWFSWNPRYEDDAVELLLRGKHPHPRAIVVEVNYTDNPFLSETVLEEAQFCEKNDPENFPHIWLGYYATHSSSQVFKNWVVEEFELPKDTIYRIGVDWGFAVDPTAAVRCALKGRTLYIDYEVYAHGCEIIDTPELLNQIPGASRFISIGDSARPETISYMQKHGFPKMQSAKKGKASINDGIEWIRSLRVKIHPRCKHTIDEFRKYQYRIDSRTGEVQPILVDANNHCIAEGEKVLTHRGSVSIENVRFGDFVLTRDGFKRVVFSGVMDRNRETVLVRTTNGKLCCTPDHRIYTANRGFIRADALRYNDEVFIVPKRYVLCLNLLSMAVRFGEGIQKASARLAGTISSAAQRTCIGKYGLTIMEKFREVFWFITKMVTRATMTLLIWSVSRQRSIGQDTGHPNEASGRESGWKKSALLLLNGTKAKLGGLFTGALGHLHTKTSFLLTSLANTVGRFLPPKSWANSVQTLVNRLRAEKAALITLYAFANAEENLHAASARRRVFVPGRVLTVTAGGNAKRVYDLTIDGQHEFFASRILVSNCIDAVRYACEAWRKPNPIHIHPEALKKVKRT